MALTYTAIETVTLSSSQASITFSSIPQTFTDLVVKMSARTDVTDVEVVTSVNGGALDSGMRLRGNGSSVVSVSNARNLAVNPSTATASTFANGEFYFANYAGNSKKVVSMDGVTENNATEAYQSIVVGLKNSTSAITSLSFSVLSGGALFVQHSTATLYGIKNTV